MPLTKEEGVILCSPCATDEVQGDVRDCDSVMREFEQKATVSNNAEFSFSTQNKKAGVEDVETQWELLNSLLSSHLICSPLSPLFPAPVIPSFTHHHHHHKSRMRCVTACS